MQWRRRTTTRLLTEGSPKHVIIAFNAKANAMAGVHAIFAFAVDTNVTIELGIGYVLQPYNEERSRLRPHIAQSTPVANSSAFNHTMDHHRLSRPLHRTSIKATTFRQASLLRSHCRSYIMGRRRTSLFSSMSTEPSLDHRSLLKFGVSIHRRSSTASRIEISSSASTSPNSREGCQPQT